MPKNVQMPNGDVVEFPDSMADNEISAVLQAKYAPTPKAPQVDMQKVDTPKAGGFVDTISNVGSHLKNMVAGPYHAVTDAPQGAVEQGISNSQAGPVGLGLYRMFAKPSVDAVSTAVDQAKKGNLYSNDEYDGSGNYKPSAFSSAVDAIPIAGPWARNIETEAHQKGAIPALAGMGTDILAPKVVAKGAGVVAQTAGKGLQLASATPDSIKLAATRALVPGKPGELLQSALKPASRYGAGVSDTLESSIPDVVAAKPSLKGVSGFAQGADDAKDAAFQPYNNMIAPYRPPPGGIGPVKTGAISGIPIADAQKASIPAINAFEDPVNGIRKTTAAKADLYRGNLPVDLADDLRQDANAKLNSFYNQEGGDRAAALSNPETARVKAIGDTTRNQLYPFLENEYGLQPGDVSTMQQKYGQLADVSDIANKREPIFARHDPVSLSQKIVSGHGNPFSMAWNYAVQKGLTSLTNSDALVNSAVDRFQNPMSTPLPARAGIVPRMGSAIGRGLYGAGKATGSAPLAVNPLFYSALNPPRR